MGPFLMGDIKNCYINVGDVFTYAPKDEYGYWILESTTNYEYVEMHHGTFGNVVIVDRGNALVKNVSLSTLNETHVVFYDINNNMLFGSGIGFFEESFKKI